MACLDGSKVNIQHYHLLDPMKEGLGCKPYSSDEELKTAVMKLLKEQPAEFYVAEILVLIRKWNIAIEKNCDYVEKKGCNP